MLRKSLLPIVLLGVASAAWCADPSLEEVYRAATAGKLSQAQAMMEQVLRDHPNSAKAHYVEAEILEKQGRRGDAAAELKAAERIAPGLPFAKPESVRLLESRLSGSAEGGLQTASTEMMAGRRSHGVSLTTVFLIGGGMLIFIFLLRRIMQPRVPMVMGGGGMGQSYPGGPAPYGGGPMGGGGGYGPGYGGAPMGGGGMGSGLMGNLATGAAVGAGLVAGEALMHHFVDGNGNRVETAAPPVADLGWGSDGGGNDPDFGVVDNSSWDDNSSYGSNDSSSFGGGGDDWT